jgi:hypothetical protein
MPEIHVLIGPNDKSGTQIVFHNPGQHPLPPSAGKPVTTTIASGPAAHGTVNNGSSNAAQVVFDNPA